MYIFKITFSLIYLLSFFVFLNSSLYAQVSPFYKEQTGRSIRDKNNQGNQIETNNTQPIIRTCSTMEEDTLLRKKFPSFGTLDNFEQVLKIEIEKRKQMLGRVTNVIYKIPVIVHVVHNGQAIGSGENISAAQVNSQIEVLNEDFRKKLGTPGYNTHPAGADMEIEFYPAIYDPSGKLLPEPGIDRINGGRTSWEGTDIQNSLKPQTIWNPNQYFNVWTVRFGGSYSNILGYAQFPSLSNLSGLNLNGGLSTTDGVVCRFDAFGRVGNVSPSFNKGRTMTHEVGHWLGLRHIWGDVNNCNHPQDYCDDTPPVFDKNYGCTAKNTCITSPNDAPDMIENYMDYSNDACMNIFTLNQKARMRAVLEVSPRRKELLNSNIQVATDKPLVFFDADKETICSGTTIFFKDESKNSPTTWQWDFFNASGTIVGTFFSQNPALTFNTPGIYDVRLIASNTAGKDTLLKPNYISVLSNTLTTLPFNETVESTTTSSVLPGWIIFNPDKDKSWQIAGNVSANGVGTRSIVFDNYDPSVDLAGKIDALMSTKLNLATSQHLQVSFDVAYAQYDNDYNDTLALYYSTDCGATFTPFWFKGGKDLATAANTTNAFAPTTTQWRTEKISLTFLNGNSSVYLAFANISGWGNRLFIDNIKLEVPTITQIPVTSFYASNTNVCQGSFVQFNDNSSNTPTSWSWEFQGGVPTSSLLQHPRIRYDNPGVYPVRLTGTNTLGSNSQLRSSYINVVAKPTIVLSANKPTICEGDSVQLAASGGQTYIWYNDREDIIGSGESIKVYPVQNTFYKAVGTNASGCINTQTISITVNRVPAKPVITLSGNAMTVTAVSGITYQWYSGNNLINGATGNSFTPSINGLYYVVAKNANNCTIKSDVFNYTTTGIGTTIIDESDEFLLYPNPAKDIVQVKMQGQCMVTITSIQGVKLINNTFLNETRLDVSRFPKGAYVVEVRRGNQYYRKMMLLH